MRNHNTKNSLFPLKGRVQFLSRNSKYRKNPNTGVHEIVDTLNPESSDRLPQNGKGYQFDGVGYIKVNNDNSLNFGTDSFQIEMDVIFADFANDYDLIHKNTATGQTGYLCFYKKNTDTLEFGVRLGSSTAISVIANASTVLGTGKHTILADINRSSDVVLYVDEVEATRVDISSSSTVNIDNTNDLYIGVNSNNLVNYFTGQLSNIIQRDINGKVLHKWNCDEDETIDGYSLITYDSADTLTPAHGTKTNVTLSTFHIEDIRFASEQNRIGYATIEFLAGMIPLNSNEEPTYGSELLDVAYIVIEGDSLSESDKYQAELISLYDDEDKTLAVTNEATGGNEVSEMITQGSTLDLLLTGTTNKMIFLGGVNDWRNDSGLTKEELYTLIETYVRERRVAGWKIYVLTLLPANTDAYHTGWEEARTWINNKIMTELDCTGYVDFAGTGIGDEGDNENLTYYLPDELHLTSAGYDIMASTIKSSLNTLLFPLQTIYTGEVPNNAKITNANIVKFDGTSEADFGSLASVEVQDFTLNIMINPTTSLLQEAYFSGQFQGTTAVTEAGWVLRKVSAGYLQILSADTTGGWDSVSASSVILEAGKWYDVEVVKLNDVISISIDGLVVAKGVLTINYTTGANKHTSIGVYYFNDIPMNISTSKIGSVILKDGNGIELLNPSLATGYGTTLYDKSGNENHGTLHNITMSTFYKNDTTGKVVPHNMRDGFNAGLYFALDTSEISLSTAITITDGDTLEFHIEVSSLPVDRGLFDCTSTGAGAFIRTDGDIRWYNDAGSYLQFNNNMVASNVYKYKVIRTGDSWALYNDTVLVDTQTLTGTFTIDIIGRFSTFELEGSLYRLLWNDNVYNLHTLTTVDAEKLYIPALSDGSGNDVLGNPLTNPQTAPAGKLYHNGCEATIENYLVPALYKIQQQLSSPYLYNSTTEVKQIEYADIVYDVEDKHLIFANAEDKAKRDMILYDEPQTGDNLVKVNKFIKKP